MTETGWRPQDGYAKALPHEEIRALRATVWMLEEERERLRRDVAALRARLAAGEPKDV